MAIPTDKPAFGVLDGVKIVYAAMEEAVPKACCIMADWGADVTWLENTGAGDTVRDTEWVKQAERRNQRSVALNYFAEDGKEILFKMIEDADIFIEASKGGTYAKKGITDEALWARNPKLVIVHVSGYGQTGTPDRVNRAAYDLTVMAYSGYMCQNGTQDQPMNPGPYTGDYINSLTIIGAALAALYKVQKTGEGESIDVAMFESLMNIGQYYLVDYLNAGVIWPRPGARNQNLCGIGEYKCADGFIGLCVYGVAQNKYLLEAIGLGELWGTEDYPEDTSALWLSSPKAALIEQKLEEYLLTRNVLDVEADFSAHRIAAQKVMEFPDLVAEEHLAARGVWQNWTTGDGREFKGLGVFPKFERNPGQIWRPMPEQGEDTVDVLSKLGYAPEQIENYIATGVVKAS
ncbi:MAG: L-carnitine CoA-transferase [Propionibacteriaceae bacterium]|jgi:L-carnitine CoA-transferase|nr:L-carnitine CoA-transferase [Propionibacteriaceae bacterium]